MRNLPQSIDRVSINGPRQLDLSALENLSNLENLELYHFRMFTVDNAKALPTSVRKLRLVSARRLLPEAASILHQKGVESIYAPNVIDEPVEGYERRDGYWQRSTLSL